MEGRRIRVSQSRGSESQSCPVLLTASIISDKWSGHVIRAISNGINRFGTLERSVTGIGPQTLSGRLKRLEKMGIISRTASPESPPRVEYALTSMGQELIPLLDHLREYGAKWLLSPVVPGVASDESKQRT